jgi:hypothetical protein
MIVNSIRGTGKQVVFTDMADVIATYGGTHQPAYDGSWDYEWHGSSDLASAISMLANGWDAGRRTVDAVVGSLESELQTVAHDMVQEMVYDTAGAYPDMGRYMEGEPECMVQYMPTPDTTSGQVTRILVDNGASAKYSADWMTKRAGAVAALVHVLGMVGKSVEVWIASPVTINGKHHDTVVCVHRAGTPLNVDSIAFALGHPSMLRRIMFEARYDKTTGHGAAGHTQPHIAETLDYVQPHIVIQRAENEPSTVPDPVDKPLEWVRFQLDKLGLLEFASA